MENAHGGNLHRCVECEYKFTNKDYLEEHRRTAHGCNRYCCVECEYELINKNDLQKHGRHTHGRIRYRCVKCGKEETTILDMNKHVNNRRESKITCDSCRKACNKTECQNTQKIAPSIK